MEEIRKITQKMLGSEKKIEFINLIVDQIDSNEKNIVWVVGVKHPRLLLLENFLKIYSLNII